MTEDEEFFAWLDGELDAEAAGLVAAKVAASPELAAKAERHRGLVGGLKRAFDPVLEANSEPPRFRAEVIDFGARAAERQRGRFGLPQWAAMAATLVLGLVVGGQLAGGDSGAPVAVEGSRLVAAAELDQALDMQLASAPAADGPRIGLTFRDASGRICRSFRQQATSGLACRDGEQWQIRGMFQGPEGQASDYRMAAGEDPRLATLIDETIAGEPFDAAQEKAALARGWR